jgi:hypothetical protein
MNRLLKWSAESYRRLDLASGTVGSAEVATLTVDVNTAPDGPTFQYSDQVSIFAELGDELERLCRANNIHALL